MKYSDLKLVKNALKNVNKDLRSPESQSGPLFVRKFEEKLIEETLNNEDEESSVTFELKKEITEINLKQDNSDETGVNQEM